MRINLKDEESKDMIHQDLDKIEHTTGIERITISAFDLYSCKVGDGSGKYRVITFLYETCCIS